MSNLINLVDYAKRNKRHKVTFERTELRTLLEVYSRRVATGEWRDYAVDQHGPVAMFSIFRHSYETPTFSIVKTRNGKGFDYAVMSSRRTLKKAGSLHEALKFFDKPLSQLIN